MEIKCYDYWKCDREKSCPYFSSGEKRYCWEVDIAHTPFVGSSNIKKEHKPVICGQCLYFQHVNNN